MVLNIARLISPKNLKPQWRVVAHELQPRFSSLWLNAIMGGALEIYVEMDSGGEGFSWSLWPQMEYVSDFPHELVPVPRLVSAYPQNDDNRFVPADAERETFWMLMAFLEANYPLEAPVCSMRELWIADEKRVFFALWDKLYGANYRLYLIRADTRHEILLKRLERALILVSQPIND